MSKATDKVAEIVEQAKLNGMRIPQPERQPIPKYMNKSVTPFDDVVTFHKKYSIQYDGIPRKLDPKHQKFRTLRLVEEMREYLEATAFVEGGTYNDISDDEARFDALIDLIYIALGTIHQQGWDFNEGWRRVQAANMAKRLAGEGEGKYGGAGVDIIKPDGWTPPDLSDLVAK